MSGWRAEEVDKAAALWKQGLSAGQIAKELGRSRNSVCGIADRKRDLFPPRGTPGSTLTKAARARAQRDTPADAGLKKRIVNQLSRDARNRDRAIEKAQALRNGEAPAEPIETENFDIASVFTVDPTSGTKGDFSRLKLSGVESVAFVDLKNGQCKLPLVGFHEVAGPFSPCCGADTGDVTRPWCTAHTYLLRAA